MAWFCVKGALAGAEPRAGGEAPEHGEHLPFDTGSAMSQVSISEERRESLGKSSHAFW